MFMRTQRLLLRPVWNEDAAALTKAIADEAIVRNLAMAPWPYTLEDAQKFIQIDRPVATPNFMVMRRTHAAPELIGSCGLLERNGCIEIGYWIARKHWGLGYATEAANAILQIALALGHTQIHAGYFADNPASGHVLRKLGFMQSGPVRDIVSLGRGAKTDLIPMCIKDLAKTLESNEREGGCKIAMRPPAYYDSYYDDEHRFNLDFKTAA